MQKRRALRRVSRTSRCGVALLVCGLLLPAWPVMRVGAATLITVNSLADTVANDGRCTLREAVATANADFQIPGALSGECAAGSGTDTIRFQSGLTGTITLTTGELALTENVTVDGPGPGTITVSGNDTSRIFRVDSGVTATIRDLTLTHGRVTGANDGGAVLNNGGLILRNVAISASAAPGDSGGGANTTGSMTVIDSTISGNAGGGLRSAGGTAYLNVVGSTISGNTGGAGGISISGGTSDITGSTVRGNGPGATSGGIFVAGGTTVTLTDSTVRDNISSGSGGGIANDGDLTLTRSTVSGNEARGNFGGGIASVGTLTLVNSTVSGNRATRATGADGGGISQTQNVNQTHGLLTLRSSTITNNTIPNVSGVSRGRGLFVNDGTVDMANSILAGNPGVTSGDIEFSGFNFADRGNNLVGIVIGTSFGSSTITPPFGPLLGALADNGGPVQTHLPQPTSPAINAGSNALCAAAPVSNTDARNVARPQGTSGAGGTCDIGAVEYVYPDTLTVSPEGRSDGDGVRVPLRSIADALVGVRTGGTVVVFPERPGSAYNGDLTLTRNVTVRGAGEDVHIVGGSGTRVFLVNSGVVATLDRLTITDGDTTNGGGGIRNDGGTLTVTRSIVRDNASGGGGGIANVGGTLTVEDTTIRDNSGGAGGGGGILNNGGGTVTLSRSTLSGNRGSSATVASLQTGSTLSITNTTISGNSSGGLSVSGGTATVRFSTITGNAGSFVGGLRVSGGSVQIGDSIVVGNGGSGGTDVIVGTPGTLTDLGRNLVGTVSGATFGGTGSATGVTNPGLGPLADNGGLVRTQAVLPDSPALNAGTTPCTLPTGGTDARGFPRPVGGACDIGAFEVNPAIPAAPTPPRPPAPTVAGVPLPAPAPTRPAAPTVPAATGTPLPAPSFRR